MQNANTKSKVRLEYKCTKCGPVQLKEFHKKCPDCSTNLKVRCFCKDCQGDKWVSTVTKSLHKTKQKENKKFQQKTETFEKLPSLCLKLCFCPACKGEKFIDKEELSEHIQKELMEKNFKKERKRIEVKDLLV